MLNTSPKPGLPLRYLTRYGGGGGLPQHKNQKMTLIKCEISVRQKASEMIEDKLCSISEDEDVVSFNINCEEN